MLNLDHHLAKFDERERENYIKYEEDLSKEDFSKPLPQNIFAN